MRTLYLILLVLAAIAFAAAAYCAVHPRPQGRGYLALLFIAVGLLLWELVDLIRLGKT